ncbi:MAG TPA: tetratricopeptide repeat protein, partial [Gemmataceae bacterium]|nr:tetratricopeptide repeat protein [Gemmataceae bacterium]
MRKYVLQSIVGGSCLLLLAGVGYFALYPHWLAYRHTTQAQQALDRYDLAQAQVHLERVLQLQPSNAEMRFLMARTCRRAANYPTANHHLSEARRLGWVEDMLELEEHLSDAQRQGPSGPNEKVLQALVRARHPEDRAILEALYKGYRNALYLNEATTWLTVWIERYPNDWLPYLWRGDLLQSFRHFDKARADYQRLLELKADCSEAHLHLGQIALANAEESETALHHFRTYLGSHPGDAEALLGIAQCQTNLHHPEAAIATLRELLVQHPEHAAGMRLLAMREME